jgi:hypothetical protein
VRPVLGLVGVGVHPAVDGELAPFRHRLPEQVAAHAGDGEQRAAKTGVSVVEPLKQIEAMVRLMEVIEVDDHDARSYMKRLSRYHGETRSSPANTGRNGSDMT